MVFKARSIIAIIAFVVVLQACRKDPALEEQPGSGANPTLITLPIPSWAFDEFHVPLLPANNPTTVEGVALGRKLFYEKALSNDFSMSCASCHRQEHAFSDPRQFSVGTNGTLGTRNAMAIQNTVWDHFFFWDTRAATLEQQALMPVTNHAEMNNSWAVVAERLQQDAAYPPLFKSAFGTEAIDSLRVVFAIAQFERTLLSFNSPYDRFVFGGDASAMTEQQQRGMDLFMGEARCNDCHVAPRFNDHGVQNVGMPRLGDDLGLMGITGNEADRGRFKNVSLRNIAVSAPYMHDGRFTTLEEVMDFYADDVEINTPNLDEHMFGWTLGLVDLDAQERVDLVAFMHALTDEDFLTNPAFSDPH